MTSLRVGAFALAWSVVSAPVIAAEAPSQEEARDAKAVAASIDRYFEGRWRAAGVEPALLADDAEFLRRVYVDLAGRVPSVAEARTFLGDPKPDKRARLIDMLLSRPTYGRHFAHYWRSQWMAESNTTYLGRLLMPGFEAWLRKKLDDNAGYDRMVHEVLTVPVEGATQAFNFAYLGGVPTPAGFLLAKESKSENLAGSSARAFLGIRLECAQCHDHPFATWKREQFWGLAAFFAGIQVQRGGDITFPTSERSDRREITIPGVERVVQAAFLDGSEPRWKFQTNPRATLADWVTAPANPYFSRAAVNKLWAQLLGMGLTEPVDDMMGQETVAHHQVLLDELAKQFAANGFDLKFMLRAITYSKVYQLASAARTATDPALFARRPLKGMSGEQLFDSLAMATGYQDPPTNNPYEQIFGGSPRLDFLSKFSERSEKSTEAQTSILHALALMNGSITAEGTSLERGATLAAVVDVPFMSLSERIETLYLAALARPPRESELARAVKYIERAVKEPEPEEKTNAKPKAADWANIVSRLGKFAGDVGAGKVAMPQRILTEEDRRRNRAIADVYWALLNSGEFRLNH